MTILYSTDVGFFRTVCRWHGTVIPKVLHRPFFWATLFLHLVFNVSDWLLVSNNYCWTGGLTFEQHIIQNMSAPVKSSDGVLCGNKYSGLPALDWKLVTVLASLLIFFLVFFSGQTYTRFYAMYSACRGIGGAAVEWCTLVQLHLSHASLDARWNAMRLLLGAQSMLLYREAGARMDSSVGWAKSVSDIERKKMVARGVLTHEEIEAVTRYAGSKPFAPVSWALAEVRTLLLDQQQSERSSAPPPDGETPPAAASAAHGGLPPSVVLALEIDSFERVAFAFKSHAGVVSNLLRQPVPLPYFHLMHLLLLLTLILIAYGLVPMGSWPITTVVQAMASLTFIGLREIAVAMAHPFGDDDVDFDIEEMLRGSYCHAVAALTDERKPCGGVLPAGLANPAARAGGHSMFDSVDAADELRGRRGSARGSARHPSSRPQHRASTGHQHGHQAREVRVVEQELSLAQNDAASGASNV